MKNKKITMMELLQRIYNNNAPKKIKYDGQRYKLHELLNVYEAEETGNQLGYNYKLDLCLNDKVEILPEENNEWEDIEELAEYIYTENYTKESIEYNRKVINQLIKNQRKIIEKLESKDE